jgi:hypothetical protein
LKAQEEPTLANEDDITPTDDRDYVLDDGGGLVSNADAEMTFIECVNNTVPQSGNLWTDSLNYDSDL